MKNVLNLTGILCLFATLIFTSCGKDNEITDTSLDLITEQKVSDFLDQNPSPEEVKDFFSSVISKTTETESINSLEDLPAEYAEYLTIDPTSYQAEQGAIQSRTCGDIVSFCYFSGGAVAFAHDPTNSNNNYIALLKKDGVIINAEVSVFTNTILHTFSLPNCGNYSVEVYAQENEPGCTPGYQFLNSANATITDCF